MRKRLTLIAVALVAVAAVAISVIAPASAFTTAVEDLSRSNGAATFTIRSTPESLQAFATRAGGHLSIAGARKILGSSLTISSSDQGGAPQAHLLLNVAGNDAVEVRVVNGTSYIRADVRSLLRIFGADPSWAGRLAQVGRLAGLDFVEPAVEGRWLAFGGAGRVAGHLSDPFELARRPDRALRGLAGALSSNADVKTVGQDEAGTHLVVAVPLQAIYAQLVAVAGDLVADMPLGVKLSRVAPAGSGDLTIDAWVSNGRFTQLEFHLEQLLELAGGRSSPARGPVALRMAITPTAPPLRTPPGAVPATP